MVTFSLAGCSGTTTGATSVGQTTATLNALVSCSGGSPTPCSFYFQWGTGGAYQFRDAASSGQHAVISNLAVSWSVSNLTPGTTYTYEICGKGDTVASYVCVSPRSFTTQQLTWQQWNLNRINAVRAAHGVSPALAIGGGMASHAQAWANHLAAGNLPLADDTASSSTCFANGGTHYGANAANGTTPYYNYQSLQYALEASPEHLANMLNGHFRWVGFGLATSSTGMLYLIQDFCG
jgi:uncharacterized protein YkwD